MSRTMRGVFAIPPTPFHEDGDLDEASLRRLVRFIIAAGADGVVTPVNASEFAFLTDAERQRVVEIAVSEAGGRVPVIAGVTAPSVEQAVVFAEHADRVGAAAVIAMPPYVLAPSVEQIRAYYAAIAAQARPVFVQNHLPPVGTAMDPALVAELVRDLDGVDYVKEECWPPGQHMSTEIKLAGAALKGVMGGMAGRHLPEEYRRGSAGTMPACEIVDVHVQLWRRLEEQDWEEAQHVFAAMLPLLNLEAMHGVAMYKEVLLRRGLIESARVRTPNRRRLDDHDRRALDAALAHTKPLLTADASGLEVT